MKWYSKLSDFVSQRWIPGAAALTFFGVISTAFVLWILDRAHAAEVITAIAHLAWPVAVAIIAYWFQDDVSRLFSRLLEAKFPGGEARFAQSSQQPTPKANVSDRRSEMEYKILKTLWSKQVNLFPNFENVWTFWPGSTDPDFLDFREAAGKLIGQGLVDKASNGQIHLTRAGFDYCKLHHCEFPVIEEWFPHEKLNPERLKEALKTAVTFPAALPMHSSPISSSSVNTLEGMGGRNLQ
jgi:hypothetical protein